MSYSHRFFLLWLALVLGSTKMFTSRTLAAAICCNQLDQGATRQFLSREAFLEIFEKRSQNIFWFTVALINLRESRSTIANNLVLRSWFHGPSGVHFDKAAEESRQELKDRELRLQVDGWDAGMKINEDMSMQIESVSYRNTWRSGEVLRISMIHHALFSLSLSLFFISLHRFLCWLCCNHAWQALPGVTWSTTSVFPRCAVAKLEWYLLWPLCHILQPVRENAW